MFAVGLGAFIDPFGHSIDLIRHPGVSLGAFGEQPQRHITRSARRARRGHYDKRACALGYLLMATRKCFACSVAGVLLGVAIFMAPIIVRTDSKHDFADDTVRIAVGRKP